MAARLVPERVQLVIEKREPFALTYSLPIDAARRNPREVVLAGLVRAPLALDASASSAEPHAPAPDDQQKPKRPADALSLVASRQQRCGDGRERLAAVFAPLRAGPLHSPTLLDAIRETAPSQQRDRGCR